MKLVGDNLGSGQSSEISQGPNSADSAAKSILDQELLNSVNSALIDISGKSFSLTHSDMGQGAKRNALNKVLESAEANIKILSEKLKEIKAEDLNQDQIRSLKAIGRWIRGIAPNHRSPAIGELVTQLNKFFQQENSFESANTDSNPIIKKISEAPSLDPKEEEEIFKSTQRIINSLNEKIESSLGGQVNNPRAERVIRGSLSDLKKEFERSAEKLLASQNHSQKIQLIDTFTRLRLALADLLRDNFPDNENFQEFVKTSIQDANNFVMKLIDSTNLADEEKSSKKKILKMEWVS